MNETRNPQLSGLSRTLRKHMTAEERHLWYDFMKSLPVTVHRQKVIGKYIVDFCIADPPLVIELDGSQHGEGKQLINDRQRDAYLQGLGYKVLRYCNWQIKNQFDFVCQDIWQHALFDKSRKADKTAVEK